MAVHPWMSMKALLLRSMPLSTASCGRDLAPSKRAGRKRNPKMEPLYMAYGICSIYIYMYIYIHLPCLRPAPQLGQRNGIHRLQLFLLALSLSLSLWLKGSSQQLNAVGFQHLGLGVAHSWPTGLQNRNSVLEPWAPSAGTLGAVRVKVGAQSGTLGAVR